MHGLSLDRKTGRRLAERIFRRNNITAFGASGLVEGYWHADNVESVVHEVCHVSTFPPPFLSLAVQMIRVGNDDIDDVVDYVFERIPKKQHKELEIRTLAAGLRIGKALGLYEDENAFICNAAKASRITRAVLKVRNMYRTDGSKRDAKRAVRFLREWGKK